MRILHIFLKIHSLWYSSSFMYFWYELLFHRPQIFICKSLNKSGLFSRSVETPDLRLFAEIFLSLNLLFANSFFRIPERVDVVSNFPEANWKIGNPGLLHPFFRDDFFSEIRAWMGQKFLLGKANKSTISGLLPVVLGVLTVTEIFELESNSKSAHEQCEKGSNEF